MHSYWSILTSAYRAYAKQYNEQHIYWENTKANIFRPITNKYETIYLRHYGKRTNDGERRTSSKHIFKTKQWRASKTQNTWAQWAALEQWEILPILVKSVMLLISFINRKQDGVVVTIVIDIGSSGIQIFHNNLSLLDLINKTFEGVTSTWPLENLGSNYSIKVRILLQEP